MAKKSETIKGGRTITRVELADAIYRVREGESRAQAAEYLEQFIEEISNSITRGEDVKLSSFGAFVVRSKPGRIGRNPKTMIEAPIASRKVVTFKSSPVMRDTMNDAAPGKVEAPAKPKVAAGAAMLGR
jgi:integration host factor subunit alpha